MFVPIVWNVMSSFCASVALIVLSAGVLFMEQMFTSSVCISWLCIILLLVAFCSVSVIVSVQILGLVLFCVACEVSGLGIWYLVVSGVVCSTAPLNSLKS